MVEIRGVCVKLLFTGQLIVTVMRLTGPIRLQHARIMTMHTRISEGSCDSMGYQH